MNNWDTRPTIQVYMGNVEMFHITNIVVDRMLANNITQQPVVRQVGEEYCILTNISEGIQEETIKVALEYLEHLSTESLEQWAEVRGDYLVDVEENLYLTEWYGKYKASKIDVEVHYFSA